MNIALRLRMLLGCLSLTPMIGVSQVTGDPGAEQSKNGHGTQHQNPSPSSRAASMEQSSVYPQVLIPASHPAGSETYIEHFPRQPLPLDEDLSWKERFNGDESFNPKVTLDRLRASTKMNTVGDSAKRRMSSQPATPMPAEEASAEYDSTGVVQLIRPGQGKIKLKHGPIKRIEMPAMTMLFKVSEPHLLDGLEKGAEISFNVDNSSSGLVITRISPLPTASVAQTSAATPTMENTKTLEPSTAMNKTDAKTKMDAVGVIRAIRGAGSDSVKIKIEHGPIEKFGMPGMTMLFGLKDGETLGETKEGSKVEFNVDNSSKGFVITNIREIEQ